MGFLDRLFGREGSGGQQRRAGSEDDRAIERYRYLMRTAPPDDIERVHQEAFAKLTAEQRADLRHELTRELPEAEARAAADDPQTLARLATRAELRQPGSVERALAATPSRTGQRGGPGFGTMFAGSLLGSVVGMVIGSAIAQQLFAGADMADAREFGEDHTTGDHHDDHDGDIDTGADGDFGGGSGEFD